jgi:predicted transcriptional regulator
MTETLTTSADLLELTADIVAAQVSNNTVAVSDLPALIAAVHRTLAGLGGTPAPTEEPQTPAVAIRASIKPDYIVCLEDGKKLKMLKRHLMTHYKMTPDQYRAKWKLPADYPMVSPNYAQQRSALALKIGLGRKAVAAPEAAAAAPKKPRATAGRKPAAKKPVS